MLPVLGVLGELRLSDAIDIAIVSFLIWAGISWFREARARMALGGLVVLFALYWAAQGLELRLTVWLLQGFFALAALVLVVVFQDDLRRLFERITVLGLRLGAPRPPAQTQMMLSRLLLSFAEHRVGALIVIPGREPLERHLGGGIHLGGFASEELLRSLFDSGTPGHDGAVVLHGNRVSRFGVHLPLSTDWNAIGSGGTRHAAALGLAERSDALCLVVSEERGEVSAASEGKILPLANAAALEATIEAFLEKSSKRNQDPIVASMLASIARRWREGLLATVAATGLWFIAVPGAAVDRAVLSVPIAVENLPEGYTLSGVDPPEIEVTFEGRRRDLYLARTEHMALRLDALLVQLGRRTFQVDAEQIPHPGDLVVVSMKPERVKLRVQQ